MTANCWAVMAALSVVRLLGDAGREGTERHEAILDCYTHGQSITGPARRPDHSREPRPQARTIRPNEETGKVGPLTQTPQADGPQGSSRHSAVEILTGACAADLDASVKAGELHRFFTVLPSGIER